MQSRRRFLTSAAALASLGLARPGFAKQPMFYSRTGAVIGGYDVVAYFTEGRPVKGQPKHALTWKGSTFQFSSAENRDRFEMNPMGYIPQYGGYCAWAVSRGYTASVVPEAWDIVEGKLYLCYSTSVLSRWQNNVLGNIRKGDANWPDVLNG